MEKENKPLEEQYPLLWKINSPADLKALPPEKIGPLSEEIRSYLIEQISENGGHLASNLGVVELTLAIHRVFSAPKDHIIFDVGHQCYVHKLITGRRDAFSTVRQNGGISGFPKRSESDFDAFGTGHSSTSLSAALGFAEADLLNHSDAYTVCVLGDGAYTGGMIHEALNNCKKGLRLIIVLNENEMSISKNNGRLAKNLSKLRASHGYIKTKNVVGRFFRIIPFIGKWIFKRLVHFKQDIKTAVYGGNVFEDLDLIYMGPADGNRESTVEQLLEDAKNCASSCIIHLKTQKGKGYTPAEKTPDQFHGMAPANSQSSTGVTFSRAMGEYLCKLADTNPKICAITAAMATGTGLDTFQKGHPRRFFDVGIAEEHAVTFAAGLAANGMQPAVAVYSTFLQRAYDNIIHDVALQNLPVVFFVDRAGLNAGDGPTHAGVFDVAFLLQIPGMRIYTPITIAALERAINRAFAAENPVAIRYPNGKESPAVLSKFYSDVSDSSLIRADFSSEEEPQAVILTHGRIVTEAILAEEHLAEQGIRTGIVYLEQIAPYEEISEALVSKLPKNPCTILFLEEEIRTGGFGMVLSNLLGQAGALQNKTVRIMALDNAFVTTQPGQTILQTAGLSAAHIEQTILDSLKK